MNKIAQVIKTAADYIATLQEENTQLKSQLADIEFMKTSGSFVRKAAEVSDLSESKIAALIRTLTPEQLRLFEKMSGDEFRLGGASDVRESVNASDRLLQFCR